MLGWVAVVVLLVAKMLRGLPPWEVVGPGSPENETTQTKAWCWKTFLGSPIFFWQEKDAFLHGREAWLLQKLLVTRKQTIPMEAKVHLTDMRGNGEEATERSPNDIFAKRRESAGTSQKGF